MEAGKAYDELIESHAYIDHFLNPIGKAENRYIMEHIESAELSKGKVLDLGCGNGLFLDYIHKVPDEYIGLDISDKMIATAKELYPSHRFDKGDFNLPLPYADGEFDNVISLFGSFSHCLTPFQLITEINRILKTGGHFLIMTLSHKYRHRKSFVMNAFDYDVPTIFYDSVTLQAIFNMGNSLICDVAGFSRDDCLRKQLIEKEILALLKADYPIRFIRPELFYFLNVEGEKIDA